jgi:hypothetical protein
MLFCVYIGNKVEDPLFLLAVGSWKHNGSYLTNRETDSLWILCVQKLSLSELKILKTGHRREWQVNQRNSFDAFHIGVPQKSQ